MTSAFQVTVSTPSSYFLNRSSCGFQCGVVLFRLLADQVVKVFRRNFAGPFACPRTRLREPQAGAGQANGPALLRFVWTIFDNGLLCQLDLADLNFIPRRN